MLNCSESPRCVTAKRCAVCHGRFGLVRHYSWRPLCSKKCVNRLRVRQESDRSWLSWVQVAALGELADNRARVL
jgi:hypothetical protein